jgi:transposase
MTTKITAKEPKLYIGIDIHKKSWKIHFCTDLFDGSTLTFPSKPDVLISYVLKNYPDHEVYCAYEAGCCGYSAYRSLKEYGWTVYVVNPADIPRPAKQNYVKTDKIDCINIAKQLKNGNLQSITIPDIEREQLRSLFRRRIHLVKDLRKLKSRIKSSLLYFGIAIPEEYDNPNWSKDFINWLIDLKWAYCTAQDTLDSQIYHYRFIDEELRLISTKIRAYCRKHLKHDYYLLKSIPGIGGITAAAFLAEIGDLRRFNTFKQFASYIGMVPGIYQSGDNTRILGINPRHHHSLRSLIIEASWVAVRKDPALQSYYRKHIGRNPKSIIVKVARKLLSRMLAVIKTDTPYQIGVLV